MFVCLCNAVTESQIRAAAASGVSSVEALREELGVASQCGQCQEMAAAVLTESQLQCVAPDTLFYSAAAR